MILAPLHYDDDHCLTLAALGWRWRGHICAPVLIYWGKDHKPSDPTERARIEANGGVVIDGQLNGEIGVARAVGDVKFKNAGGGGIAAAAGTSTSLISCVADVGSTSLGPEDTFAVIACDGVWDVMSNDEVGGVVRSMLAGGQDPEAICRAVIAECFERDTKDNMTLALISI